MNATITSPKLSKPNPSRHVSGVWRLMSFLFVCLCLSTAAYAQKSVSGKVTDATDNSGLPGVSVSVKGTTTGTVTDASGAYTLNVPNDNSTLVFSFVGYVTQETVVGSRASINVALAADVQSLQEVVVIGYGEQQKKDVTGGVVALGPKDFNKGIIASPEQLLQGRAAGIQITPASGEPGAGINIRIRGGTSLRNNNNPLFVIDGVPVDGGATQDGGQDVGAGTSSPRNPLNFLNPSDIENISVLKDASAAAIYGARGANGVVLITTRRGRAGQKTLNFSASTTASSTLRRYDLLSSSQFLAGVQAAGGDINTPVINAGGNTDWQNEIFRTSLSQNYNLSFGGGNEDTRYFVSFGYQDQQGIIKKSAMNRITGRVNATHEMFNDKLVFDVNLTSSRIKDINVPVTDNAGFQGNLLGAALQANPTYPVYDAQGRYFTPNGYRADNSGRPNGGDFINPVGMLQGVDDNTTTMRTLANASLTWKIIKGLAYKANVGLDNSAGIRRTSVPPIIPGFNGANDAFGFGIINNLNRTMALIEHTLTYNNKVGIGNLDAVAGFSFQQFNNSGSFSRAQFFLPEYLATGLPLYNNLRAVNNQGSGNKAFDAGSYRNRNELQSYFGRVNYNINDKYLLTATLRVDGSSRFGINNKYGYFPSLAAAWRLSNENFMPQGIFDDLKLRASWGITGNQDFAAVGVTQPFFSFDPNNASATPANPTNADLKWEQTRQWNVGLDFALIKSRLTGSVDVFNKNTTDFLINQFVAQPAPIGQRWVNLPGNLINKGVEVTLNYEVLQNTKLQWNISYNMTFLSNTVSGIGTIIPTGAVRGQGLSGAFAQTIRDGYPANAFFLREFGGYNDQGLGIYPNGENLTYAGSPFPKTIFGLTNSFTYGPWNLSLFFNGSTGFNVYNNTANALFLKGNLRNGRNVTQEVADSEESPNNFGEASTRFLEKGDFIRLSNFTLGHNFKLPEGGFAKTLNISLTGQNVLLFTKYSGVDPEVNTNASLNGVPSIGMDYTSFPTARAFTLGLNVGF
jgi:TonB-linked SusC/RagA family outer membrane protein